MIDTEKRLEIINKINNILLEEKGITPFDVYGILDSVKVAFIGSVIRKTLIEQGELKVGVREE